VEPGEVLGRGVGGLVGEPLEAGEPLFGGEQGGAEGGEGEVVAHMAEGVAEAGQRHGGRAARADHPGHGEGGAEREVAADRTGEVQRGRRCGVDAVEVEARSPTHRGWERRQHPRLVEGGDGEGGHGRSGDEPP
jgi:hypothetical protein